MIIENNKKLKVSEVWLITSEKDDVQVRVDIDKLAKFNNKRKWRTVVFQSGKQDLYENTENLILRNTGA